MSNDNPEHRASPATRARDQDRGRECVARRAASARNGRDRRGVHARRSRGTGAAMKIKGALGSKGNDSKSNDSKP
jgi:hypothetical protein